jgi:hypothetical protein
MPRAHAGFLQGSAITPNFQRIELSSTNAVDHGATRTGFTRLETVRPIQQIEIVAASTI